MEKLQYLGLKVRKEVESFFTKENGEVNIVAMVILLGIAVILALTFKKYIVGFVNDIFKSIDSQKGEIMSST